jgi:hypothetical protein
MDANFLVISVHGQGGIARKRRRFTEEQIAFALQQAESGSPVEEICRKIGFFRNDAVRMGGQVRVTV